MQRSSSPFRVPDKAFLREAMGIRTAAVQMEARCVEEVIRQCALNDKPRYLAFLIIRGMHHDGDEQTFKDMMGNGPDDIIDKSIEFIEKIKEHMIRMKEPK